MTQAPARDDVATPDEAAGTPQGRVDAWLARFEAALAARDVAAAAALFATDSYWRDLVAFTWNLKTVEGPAGSPTCSSTHPRPRAPAASPPRSRRTRRTAWSPPGSTTRPPSVAVGVCSGSSWRTARTAPSRC